MSTKAASKVLLRKAKKNKNESLSVSGRKAVKVDSNDDGIKRKAKDEITQVRRRPMKLEPTDMPQSIEGDYKVFSKEPHKTYVLQQSIKMMEEGRTQEYICEFLNAHGFRTWRGQPLQQAALSKFLIQNKVRRWSERKKGEGITPSKDRAPKLAKPAAAVMAPSGEILESFAKQVEFMSNAPLPEEVKDALIEVLADLKFKRKN